MPNIVTARCSCIPREEHLLQLLRCVRPSPVMILLLLLTTAASSAAVIAAHHHWRLNEWLSIVKVVLLRYVARLIILDIAKE